MNKSADGFRKKLILAAHDNSAFQVLFKLGGPHEKIEIIPKDFEILTYKCLNFLNFLTYTKICQKFSLITKKLGKFQE